MVTLGIHLGRGTLVTLFMTVIIVDPLLSILLSKPVPFGLNHGGRKLYLTFNKKSYAQQVAMLNNSQVIEYRKHILGNEERVSP